MTGADVHMALDERDVPSLRREPKEDAIIMLEESDDAEGAEISHIRDFIVDL